MGAFMNGQAPGATDGPGSSVGSNDQRGAILPLMAIMLVVLMGAAAMAVDLGWLFWQSIEVQHGADAAALAGVVYEPSLRTEAHAEGMAAASENGYVDTSLGGSDTVQIVDFVDDPTAVDNDNQLRATVTHSVPTFFMKVFGLDSVAITRTAVAQYVLPIALGSPDPTLGADPSTGFLPGYFLLTQGTWSKKDHGDRFGAGCSGSNQGSGCPQNPEHRRSQNEGLLSASGGYLYGIEMPEGASALAVEIFDGPWYGGNWDSYSADKILTGDERDPGIFWFMLYGPDATPLDTTDGNELLCSVRYTPRGDRWSGGRDDDVGGWDNDWQDWADVSPQSLIGQLWDDMATSADKEPGCAASFDRGPGIYPLRIMIEDDSSTRSYNKFSLRVTTTGPNVSIYGLGDMATYANPGAGGATGTDIYLAKVLPQHAGQDLIIELFDVGDIKFGAGSDEITIVDGFGNIPDCRWESDGGESEPMGECRISAPDKRFNGQLLTITVPIPDAYTCSGNGCWFRFRYDYDPGAQVNDGSTWAVYVAGNPIRIVE